MPIRCYVVFTSCLVVDKLCHPRTSVRASLSSSAVIVIIIFRTQLSNTSSWLMLKRPGVPIPNAALFPDTCVKDEAGVTSPAASPSVIAVLVL